MIEPPNDWDSKSAGGGNRAQDRDSLFLLSEITVIETGEQVRARVRNLSDGGMMIECQMDASKNDEISAELRNIGLVKGRIAWAAPGRFGIAFHRPIDPKQARKPLDSGEGTPRYTRTVITAPTPFKSRF
jgi:hypothetical protein